MDPLCISHVTRELREGVVTHVDWAPILVTSISLQYRPVRVGWLGAARRGPAVCRYHSVVTGRVAEVTQVPGRDRLTFPGDARGVATEAARYTIHGTTSVYTSRSRTSAYPFTFYSKFILTAVWTWGTPSPRLPPHNDTCETDLRCGVTVTDTGTNVRHAHPLTRYGLNKETV
ncbi:hypothetical protein J6590_008080 [Homalodisca vitripennis]|nr:hypothetical protein J6590_008080 [Homalodisca vitripennis]